ncbi:aldo/keto reductase, partial [Pantoea sp.]|uniref:aldo/keto reductase n=1 Tax=Pantoea sp. TaxID=69393 RepID=UPI0039774CAB
LHQSGKVRHFGVSNFTPAQFALLQSRLPFTLATNQVEISPLRQDTLLDGTLDQCQQLRIKPMAWSCLGGGQLFCAERFSPLRAELRAIACRSSPNAASPRARSLNIALDITSPTKRISCRARKTRCAISPPTGSTCC